MELHKEDAEGWLYRGEGAANIVLAYHGDRPSFVRFFCFQTRFKL
jgi:inositol-pentakisphosphate 2-kinase